MVKKSNFLQNIKNGIGKAILWTSLTLIALIVLVLGALQMPYFQTLLAKELTQRLSELIEFKISVEHVDIRWLDTVVFDDLMIHDQEDSVMIEAEELVVKFKLRSLFNNVSRNIDLAILSNGKVHLVRSSNDSTINITKFINGIKQMTARKDKKSPAFTIDNIVFDRIDFTLNDLTRDSITSRFDQNHFKIAGINANLSQMLVIADTIRFSIDNFSGVETRNDLEIRNLSTAFGLSNRFITLDDLDLSIGNSHIKDSIALTYNNIQNLSYFVDSVELHADLDESLVYSKDLGVFAPFFKQYNEYYRVSGKVNGPVSSLDLEDLELYFGENSLITGDASFYGLPDASSTFIDARFGNSRIQANDVKVYSRPAMYEVIQKFGAVKFKGQFVGFFADFVADGQFQSDIGEFDSDLNLKINENGIVDYRGHLKTKQFDLGKYTNNPEFYQLVDMDGKLEGSGLRIQDANLKLNAVIHSIGINNYDFKNITTDAQLSRQRFEGALTVNDPNLKFNGEAYLDTRENMKRIRINALLDTLNLKPINLSQKDIFFSTKMNLDMLGLHIDSLIGKAKFEDLFIRVEDKDLFVDSLNLVSLNNLGYRVMSLESEAFDIYYTTNYKVGAFFNQLKDLYQEYRLDLMNDQDSIQAYYANKTPQDKTDTAKYSLDFEIFLKDVNPYLELINEEIFIGKNTEISGNFAKGKTTLLNIHGKADTLNLYNYGFDSAAVDLSTSKQSDQGNALAMAFIESKHQSLAGIPNFNNLRVDALWDEDRIRFESYIEHQADTNNAKFNGEIFFQPDETEIHIKDSEFNVIGNRWKFNNDNSISINQQAYQFENVRLTQSGQELILDGVVSSNPTEALNFSIRDFTVDQLNPLLETNFFGKIDGDVIFRDMFRNKLVESDFLISDFRISRFLVGDITGGSNWVDDVKHLDLDFHVVRNGQETINMSGFIAPEEEQEQLQIRATFDKANVNIIQPFVKRYVSDLQGFASGDFEILGKLNYPVLNGDGTIDEGHVKILYLNTVYDFDGKMYFDDNEIGVRQLKLMDRNSNEAYLNGGIFHDGFQDFILDISGQMEKFEVLNTKSDTDELYYGTANVTGEMNILGALRNLTITADAKTDAGTKFYIPLGNSTTVTSGDFIRFESSRDLVDTTTAPPEAPQIEVGGLKLNFDLDVTPDAYTEMIFDIVSGDIIRGRGNGKLKLEVDTKGEFNLFGDYVFESGGYNFTLSNIINKEFKINQGSKISWFGDPYKGLIDLSASYEQYASLQPLMQNMDSTTMASPELKRRYPAIVDLKLEGDLLSPDITYDIRIEDYPNNIIINGIPFSLETMVSAFDARLQSDEQFLNKQVFSLIILRRFTEEGTFYVGGETIGSSVSELLSNQLSYWISQVDENLEIDVDLSSFDEDALNTFQLRLSYTFMEGRLRVSRDGTFTNPDNTATAESILGDWTIEYVLTPDGKFRAKMFSKYNYNYLNSINNVSTTKTGASLFYTQSFSDVNSLIKKARKEHEKKQKEQSEKEASAIREEQEEINED